MEICLEERCVAPTWRVKSCFRRAAFLDFNLFPGGGLKSKKSLAKTPVPLEVPPFSVSRAAVKIAFQPLRLHHSDASGKSFSRTRSSWPNMTWAAVCLRYFFIEGQHVPLTLSMFSSKFSASNSSVSSCETPWGPTAAHAPEPLRPQTPRLAAARLLATAAV